MEPRGDESYELWPSQVLVAEAVGRLMAFWGFARNMGRIWSVLYLSERPLTARQIREGLGISAGSVSMSIKELQRWGVVHQALSAGGRSRRYEAEIDVWKMITRVLRERERAELETVRKAFEEALVHARQRTSSPDPVERHRAQVQARRIEALLDVTRLTLRLLQALVSTGRIDASPLARSLLKR